MKPLPSNLSKALANKVFASAKPNRICSRGRAFGFKHGLLPSSKDYFDRIETTKYKGSGEWVSAICPFHDDTSPSLRINLEKGAFCCMACGAKGGDVLAFHMKLHGMSFQQAAKALGAWGRL